MHCCWKVAVRRLHRQGMLACWHVALARLPLVPFSANTRRPLTFLHSGSFATDSCVASGPRCRSYLGSRVCSAGKTCGVGCRQASARQQATPRHGVPFRCPRACTGHTCSMETGQCQVAAWQQDPHSAASCRACCYSPAVPAVPPADEGAALRSAVRALLTVALILPS